MDLRIKLKEGREGLRERAASGASGREIVRGLSQLYDEVVIAAFEKARAAAHSQVPVALAAIGGFGRKEMAPHSDVDLLLLYPDGAAPPQEQAERFFTSLWDSGLEVGASTRTPEECARVAADDHTARTALLDCRYLCGDEALYAELERRVLNDLTRHEVDELIEAKVAELERRRLRYGGSVHLLEPSVKQSPGALRDLQAALWIARARTRASGLSDLLSKGVLPQREVERFKTSRDFLWRVRNQLHWINGKKEDHLTFSNQEQVAAALGYRDHPNDGLAVEQFMRDYYLAAETVRRLADELIDRCAPEVPGPERPVRDLEPGLRIWQGRVSVDGREAFARDPALLVRLFTTAEDLGLPIYPYARDLVREEAARVDETLRSDRRVTAPLRSALARLGKGDWLRQMHREGVLGALLPEFGRVTAKHQHDLYHVYTVDTHSIFAVQRLGALRAGELVEQEPELSRVARDVRKPLALTLGVLFHDAGKGLGGKHSEKGAALVKEVCRRLEVPEGEAADAEFLVLEHLAMTHVSQRRDLSDPELIADFARRMGDRERLDMLYVLTYVDVASVGPATWTSWKAGLLRELYEKTAAVLDGAAAEPVKEGPGKALLAAGFDPRRVERFLSRMSRRYLDFADPGVASLHMRLLERGERRPLLLIARGKDDRTVITLTAEDRPGLLASIAGVLSAHRVDVLSADVFSTTDGKALDIFTVRGPRGGKVEPGRLRSVRKDLASVLSGATRVEDLHERLLRPSGLPPRHVPAVETKVHLDNRSARRFTVVDVFAQDRPGLLHDVTSALHQAGLTISVARIATEGNRAVDSFYVAGPGGTRVENAARIAEIQQALTRAIEPQHA